MLFQTEELQTDVSEIAAILGRLIYLNEAVLVHKQMKAGGLCKHSICISLHIKQTSKWNLDFTVTYGNHKNTINSPMNSAKYPSVPFPMTQTCLAESMPLNYVKFSLKKIKIKKTQKDNC